MEDIPLPISNDINEETEDENESNPIKKELHTEPEIAPLPITEDTDIPKEEPQTQTHLSPPPLPIEDNDIKPPAPPSPVQSYHSPRHLPLSPTQSHLRGPPPLTPMDSIASDGTVITPNNNNYYPPIINNNYAMAPPPPPTINNGNYIIEYNCVMCRIQFNTKGELLRHNRNMHPRDESYDDMRPIGSGRKLRFYCNICGRSFSGKQHFEYHMRTHSGEKPFKCQTCGKAFRAKHSLKNHMRIHTGERPYQCKVCGKWFRQLGVMKNHIKNMHSR